MKNGRRNTPDESDNADLESDYFNDGETANNKGTKRNKTTRK